MPYRQNNYSYVIDSSFKPFSFQEMLAPVALYKEEYDKTEEAYQELTKGASVFSDLANNVDPDSKAAKIYNGYANELQAQAEDLIKNGLTIANKKSLGLLKRRYDGEIGRLERAKKRLDDELKLRRESKDPSMLYAQRDLTLDDFLDEQGPNLYGISGNELYNRGALIGKNYSSRVFGDPREGGKTLNGLYVDYITSKGITPDQLYRFNDEIMSDFTRQVSTLPELQQAAWSQLDAMGVLGNLKNDELRRGIQQVIRGIVDNAIYEEDHKMVRDENVPGWSEKDSSARGWANIKMQQDEQEFEKQTQGWSKDENGQWHYDPEKDIQSRVAVEKAAAVQKAKESGKSGKSSSSSSSSGTNRYTLLNNGVRLKWNGNNPNELNGDDDNDYEPETIANDDLEHVGPAVSYDELPQYARDRVDKIIGPNGNVDMYTYYFRPYNSSVFDTEAALEIIPQKSVIFNGEDVDMYDDTDLED